MKTFTGRVEIRVSARAKSERHFKQLCSGLVPKNTTSFRVEKWDVDEVVAIPEVPTGKLLLHLCTVGNPDHGQFAAVTEPEWHVVGSLGEARGKCRAYLEQNEGFVGGGNWGPDSGKVVDHEGVVVARFSFNLRCASPTGAELVIATQEFTVTSPDGIPIQRKQFVSREAAERGITEFVARFRVQGYYAGVDGRLAVDEIAGRCTITEGLSR